MELALFRGVISCCKKFWTSSSQWRGNCNATVYNDIVNNCVLPSLWQQFRGETHTGVMVRHPQTFVHVSYVYFTSLCESISMKLPLKCLSYIVRTLGPSFIPYVF